MNARFPALGAMTAALSFSSLSAQPASFTPLSFLPGGTYSEAFAVSADGMTVIGYSKTTVPVAQDEAFRWTAAGGILGLGTLSGKHSYAYGTSADGSVVVGQGYAPPTYTPCCSCQPPMAFRHVGGLIAALGNGGRGCQSFAYGVSADGRWIVGMLEDKVSVPGRILQKGFVWDDASGFTVVEPLTPWLNSQARGISGNGAVVVGRCSGGQFGEEGFRWTSTGGAMSLGLSSFANAASFDGSVIVGSVNSQPGVWRPIGGWQSLWNSAGEAEGVSADGEVVVGTVGNVPIVWTQANGSRRLEDVLVNEYGVDLMGYRLTAARGVSADGTVIVGRAARPTGGSEAFVARLPRSPWSDLGFPLAGTNGSPVLVAPAGILLAGQTQSLRLSSALRSSPLALVIGTPAAYIPFAGGMVVPTPLLALPGVADSSGAAGLDFPWPGGLPSGFDMFYQYWSVDSGGAQGFAASNALRSRTQ